MYIYINIHILSIGYIGQHGGNNQLDIGVAMIPLVVLKSGEPVGW